MQIIWFWINIFLFYCFIISSVNAGSLSLNHLLLVNSGDNVTYADVEQSFRTNVRQDFFDLLSIKSIEADNHHFLDELFSNEKKENRPVFDLIITVGTRAAVEVLRRSPNTRVLSVFIPRQTYLKIRHEVSTVDSSSLWSAIYLDQPKERLIALAKLITSPDAIISLFYSTSIQPQNRSVSSYQCEGKIIQTLMNNVNIHSNELSAAYIKGVLNHSDIIIPTANLLKHSPSAIKWMLYMAYQRNIPVIGFSRAFVNAGAIAAVYSTPKNVGKQAADWLNAMQQDDYQRDSSLMSPSYFEVKVNRNVARALGKASLNEKKLHKTLVESAMNCKEFYSPTKNKQKRQMTQR